MEYWNLYVQADDQLDVLSRGSRFGLLTITDEVNERVLPSPMRKCTVEFFDREAIRRQGKERTFWIEETKQLRDGALAHLNGKV